MVKCLHDEMSDEKKARKYKKMQLKKNCFYQIKRNEINSALTTEISFVISPYEKHIFQNSNSYSEEIKRIFKWYFLNKRKHYQGMLVLGIICNNIGLFLF